eukprot:scaffold27_cov355-Prasinococcus_capsulatus_cf.AAC.1
MRRMSWRTPSSQGKGSLAHRCEPGMITAVAWASSSSEGSSSSQALSPPGSGAAPSRLARPYPLFVRTLALASLSLVGHSPPPLGRARPLQRLYESAVDASAPGLNIGRGGGRGGATRAGRPRATRATAGANDVPPRQVRGCGGQLDALRPLGARHGFHEAPAQQQQRSATLLAQLPLALRQPPKTRPWPALLRSALLCCALRAGGAGAVMAACAPSLAVDGVAWAVRGREGSLARPRAAGCYTGPRRAATDDLLALSRSRARAWAATGAPWPGRRAPARR